MAARPPPRPQVENNELTDALVTTVTVANFFFVSVVLTNLFVAMLTSTYDKLSKVRGAYKTGTLENEGGEKEGPAGGHRVEGSSGGGERGRAAGGAGGLAAAPGCGAPGHRPQHAFLREGEVQVLGDGRV